MNPFLNNDLNEKKVYWQQLEEAVLEYLRSEPESVRYPGMSDEMPLNNLVDCMRSLGHTTFEMRIP